MMVAVGHASQTRSPLPAAPDAYLQCCQSNANSSPLFADAQVLGDENVAPLTKRGIALLFEPSSGLGLPFEVEVIVH